MMIAEPGPIASSLSSEGPVPSIEVEVIETLIDALHLAKMTDDPMLPRLIEAVLLHAGRVLAQSVDPAAFA